MGFKGFSSYLKKKKTYFQDYKLQSSVLVIDGNNIACVLYRQAAKTNYLFNGDYDSYAEVVRTFFKKLLLCEIEPLVILDGGFELRKLNAIQARLLYSTKDICRYRKEKNQDPFIPLLLLEVFKETLQEMKVKFAQSRFEADADLIELARILRCPLLSSDSDFYLYDTPFIPFTSLNLQLSSKVGDKMKTAYIPCKIFCIDHLLNDYGGLPDRSYLALLTLLLGDYMEVKHFKRLYLSLMSDEEKAIKLRWSDYDRLLRLLFDWFRKVESFDAAVLKIKESVPLQFKRFLSKQLKDLVNKQLNSETSPVVKLFCPTPCDDDISDDLSSRLDALHVTDDSLHDIDDPLISKLITCLSPTGKPLEIPEWFVLMERQGCFSRHITNILNLRTVLLWTQLESFDLPSAHTISFPILKIVAGILLDTSKRKRTAPLTCYVRTGCDIQKELLIPNYPDKSASFENLIQLPSAERKKILLNALQIVDFQAESLLHHWSLFFLTLIFWFKQSEGPIGEKTIFLGACFISLFLLADLPTETELENIASEPSPNLSHRNLIVVQNIMNQSRGLDEEAQGSHKLKIELGKLLCSVKSSDVLCKELDRRILHYYAELQTVTHSVLMLNSILNFPFPPIVISRSMSGSLIYSLALYIRRSSSLGNFCDGLDVSSNINDLLLNCLKFVEAYLSSQMPLFAIKFV